MPLTLLEQLHNAVKNTRHCPVCGRTLVLVRDRPPTKECIALCGVMYFSSMSDGTSIIASYQLNPNLSESINE